MEELGPVQPQPRRCANKAEKAAVPDASKDPIALPQFAVQDGYQIELWAENPLLEKPTQINWDALGRLWVCSSSLYPQIAPGEPAHDKILILEDTDRDGKADKSTVFADGLLIPTGVEPDLAEPVEGRSDEGRRPECPRPWTLDLRLPRPPATSANPPNCSTCATPTATAKPTEARRLQRLRHRGHASHHSHPALGSGWTALFQSKRLHPQPSRDAVWHGAAQFRRHLRLRSAHRTRRGFCARLVEFVGPSNGQMGPDRFLTDGAGCDRHLLGHSPAPFIAA